MPRVIHAIFENGVFRPIEKVKFPEHQEIEIIIEDDIPTRYIAAFAEKAKSFDFLADPKENIYTIKDGKPV